MSEFQTVAWRRSSSWIYSSTGLCFYTFNILLVLFVIAGECPQLLFLYLEIFNNLYFIYQQVVFLVNYYYDQLLYELSVRFSLVDLELSLLLPCLNSFSYVYIFYLWKWNYIWNAFINIYIAYLLWKCSFLPEGLFPNISYCPHQTDVEISPAIKRIIISYPITFWKILYVSGQCPSNLNSCLYIFHIYIYYGNVLSRPSTRFII